MSIRVPIVEIVRSPHLLSYLSQQCPLSLREVRNHSKAVVSVSDSVHQKWCYLGEDLNVLEWVHDVNCLFRPQHIVSWEAADQLLLILLVLILVTLPYHSYKAFETHLIERRLVDKFNLQNLVRFFRLLLGSSWVGRLTIRVCLS